MARDMEQREDSIPSVSAPRRTIDEFPQHGLGRPSKRQCREPSSLSSPFQMPDNRREIHDRELPPAISDRPSSPETLPSPDALRHMVATRRQRTPRLGTKVRSEGGSLESRSLPGPAELQENTRQARHTTDIQPQRTCGSERMRPSQEAPDGETKCEVSQIQKLHQRQSFATLQALSTGNGTGLPRERVDGASPKRSAQDSAALQTQGSHTSQRTDAAPDQRLAMQSLPLQDGVSSDVESVQGPQAVASCDGLFPSAPAQGDDSAYGVGSAQSVGPANSVVPSQGTVPTRIVASPQDATSVQVDMSSSSRGAFSHREVQAQDTGVQAIPQPHINALSQGSAPQLPSGPPLQNHNPVPLQNTPHYQGGFPPQNSAPYWAPPPSNSQYQSASSIQYATAPYQSHDMPQPSVQHQGVFPPQQVSISSSGSAYQFGPPPQGSVSYTGAPPSYHFAPVSPGTMQPPEQLATISRWITSLDLPKLQELLAIAASRHRDVFEGLREQYTHMGHERSAAEHALNCRLSKQHYHEAQTAQLAKDNFLAQAQAHQATIDAANAVRVRVEAEQAEQARLAALHARTLNFTRNVGEVNYILYEKWSGLRDSQVDAFVFEASELVEAQMQNIFDQVHPESSSGTKFNGLVSICEIAGMVIDDVGFLTSKVAGCIGYREDFVAKCTEICDMMDASEKREFGQDVLRMGVLESLDAMRGRDFFEGFDEVVRSLERATRTGVDGPVSISIDDSDDED